MMRPLPLAAILLALAAPASAQTATADGAETILELVNAAREREGLGALALDGATMEAALAHARDMAERGFYAHEGPDGGTPRSRYLAADGSEVALVAENIARCTGCDGPADAAVARELHEGWMNSPGHRANILTEGLADYGYAVAYADGPDGRSLRYAVELFAGPGAGSGGEALAAGETSERLATLLNAGRDGALAANEALARAAAAAVPQSGDLDDVPGMSSIIPDGTPFRSFQLLTASCGGCGTELTTGDLEGFIAQWREGEGTDGALADPSLEAIGAAVASDGEGGKTIVAILAGR